ncbi:tetratricopeptide repeat protein [Streptomyces sp. NBC_00154]|uniref:tetratricopeptide repeat protein n=1 Tax=Streptomyces sp. NBC_00154 TaxID=2975670 RepID=UPI00225B5C3D|nr:tetratricopeptide repeat protein [Streptomyces sp. NBC_00154]MCX5311368.1 tetratricopeptide repeat protein [Streptomyces sp. NBC_00154]
MGFIGTVWGRERGRWARDQLTPSQAVVYDRLRDLFEVGEYEEAEVGARAFAAASRRFWDRGPVVEWLAGALATAAAIAHGRGVEVLAELDALIADLERTTGAGRALLLDVRVNRVAALVDQGRYTEAEAEADGILRAAVRLAHLTKVWGIELSTLANLAVALCGQGRYEEAGAIARGNLPRAPAGTAATLHCVLVSSLNGQGRHEEALTEARRLTPLWVRTESGALDIGTATALHGLGRHSEAEATAHQALDACEQFLHPLHPRIQEARTLLSRITADGPLA